MIRHLLKKIRKMKDPIVNVSNGKLRGKTGTNINNGQFYSFQGIPYAKPPLGSLRFKVNLKFYVTSFFNKYH
jgi:carboxylesterase type B